MNAQDILREINAGVVRIISRSSIDRHHCFVVISSEAFITLVDDIESMCVSWSHDHRVYIRGMRTIRSDDILPKHVVVGVFP